MWNEGVRSVSEDVRRAYAALSELSEYGLDDGSPAHVRGVGITPTGRSSGSSSGSGLSSGSGAAAADARLAADGFGTRLMRLRLARGLSLRELALETNVSRSYLGNLERGRKRPSAAVAAACDAGLAAGGALVELAAASASASASASATATAKTSRSGPTVPLPAGAAGELSQSAVTASDAERRLRAVRAAAQFEPPVPLAAELARWSGSVACSAARAGGAGGRELWLIAARCAEFTGWLAQEAGDEAAGCRWTRTAAVWAARGGDRDMRGYQWERMALSPLYRGDAAATVALALRALTEPGVSPRIVGLALRRAAQGYALAGDRSECERTLDAARKALERGPGPYPGGPSWGPNSIGDASDFVRASCLDDAGAHAVAAGLFDVELSLGNPGRQALRTHCRFVVRGAVALARSGELDHACGLVAGVLPDLARIDSATIRCDMRRLIPLLLRHPSHQAARALLPDLHNLIQVH